MKEVCSQFSGYPPAYRWWHMLLDFTAERFIITLFTVCVKHGLITHSQNFFKRFFITQIGSLCSLGALLWTRAGGLGAELRELPHPQWKETQERIRWKYSSVDEWMDELPYLVRRSWLHSDVVQSTAFLPQCSGIWCTITAAVSNPRYPNWQMLCCHMWVVAARLDNRCWDWTGELPSELKSWDAALELNREALAERAVTGSSSADSIRIHTATHPPYCGWQLSFEDKHFHVEFFNFQMFG